MQTAEKKLGCLAGIGRTNSVFIGTIEGSVNVSLPNGGKKQVSINKDGNVVFWIVNDYDVTVFPDDIVGCRIAGNGRYVLRSGITKVGDESIPNHYYGTVFELDFADGTTGKLAIKAFGVIGDTVWKPGSGEIPKVDGWLAPNGSRDDHYKEPICPEGYRPNVVGYYKQKTMYGNPLAEIDKALNLSARFPDAFEADGSPKGLYTFDGGVSTHYVFG